jgi:DNA-binding LacI/PurR family transcriptional regulator
VTVNVSILPKTAQVGSKFIKNRKIFVTASAAAGCHAGPFDLVVVHLEGAARTLLRLNQADGFDPVVPGCDGYTEKIHNGGFTMPHVPRDSRTFPTPEGRAVFTVSPQKVVTVPPGRWCASNAPCSNFLSAAFAGERGTMAESRDTGGPVLGVLSPFLGGWYFGGVLEGIARVAADAGAAVVAVQTLDAGTDQLELVQPPHPPHPLAWKHAAGFVVIVNAASDKYLREIQATGRPVVVVSHDFPDLDCPTVFPDNRVGVRAAVEHLIQHGHRRIAFAGFMGALDQRERYETYRETLTAHGITPDPGLIFEAEDNQQAGGEGAARAMLAAGLPSTAVLAGTDHNAVGMIRVLAAAGRRLPEDQAIIGFDDLTDASFTEPRLTTIRQSLFQVGTTAAQALLSALDGTGGQPIRHDVATQLVVRESCGCPAPEFPGSEDDVVRAPETLRAEGRSQYRERIRLQRSLSSQYDISLDLLRSHEEDPRRLGWLRRTSARAGCLGLWTETPAAGDQPLKIVGQRRRVPGVAGRARRRAQPGDDGPAAAGLAQPPAPAGREASVGHREHRHRADRPHARRGRRHPGPGRGHGHVLGQIPPHRQPRRVPARYARADADPAGRDLRSRGLYSASASSDRSR